MERSFIIFRLSGFNRNLRNEIKKGKKIYFYDNGVRNAVINNFNQIGLRDDVGKLWENFLVSERIKANAYHSNFCKSYFWRTHAQQELDYLEEKNGQFFSYEFKWNENKKVKFPSNFVETYHPTVQKVINKENFHEFVIYRNEN